MLQMPQTSTIRTHLACVLSSLQPAYKSRKAVVVSLSRLRSLGQKAIRTISGARMVWKILELCGDYVETISDFVETMSRLCRDYAMPWKLSSEFFICRRVNQLMRLAVPFARFMSPSYLYQSQVDQKLPFIRAVWPGSRIVFGES